MTDEPQPSGVVARREGLPEPASSGVPMRKKAIPLPGRRAGRVGPTARRPDWMVAQLPVGMVSSDFFVRFVSIFQDLGGTLMEDADLVQHLADRTVTPVPMLRTLAAWIGVETVDESMSEQQQRTVLASSARTLSMRGTPSGLQEYLQMLSGGPAQVTDGGGVWAEGDAPGDVAWVRMTVEGTGHLSESEFVALVRGEIPAHVRAELWVAGRRVLNTEEES